MGTRIGTLNKRGSLKESQLHGANRRLSWKQVIGLVISSIANKIMSHFVKKSRETHYRPVLTFSPDSWVDYRLSVRNHMFMKLPPGSPIEMKFSLFYQVQGGTSLFQMLLYVLELSLIRSTCGSCTRQHIVVCHLCWIKTSTKGNLPAHPSM